MGKRVSKARLSRIAKLADARRACLLRIGLSLLGTSTDIREAAREQGLRWHDDDTASMEDVANVFQCNTCHVWKGGISRAANAPGMCQGCDYNAHHGAY